MPRSFVFCSGAKRPDHLFRLTLHTAETHALQAQQSAATPRQHSNATSGQPSAPVATVTGQRYANRRREEQQQHQSEQCRHNVATAAAEQKQHTQQQHPKLSLLWSNGVTRGEHRERRTYKAHSTAHSLLQAAPTRTSYRGWLNGWVGWWAIQEQKNSKASK
ncbi:hypothetical protein PTSG_07657 [Salpingoeca rosetta]|uniref:Uncharacterized protein n=1 Tax=Salpingoeca rosetta (strain ATCC 50818 / BSB-021) TaxID=946362 RepID=F2UHE3_SALR5|nr:uncharacterized protein PTSG_07657 [Salpingoeca rosetta]EGD76542.1 hypothetical protein PTSG_07657 [Salpingoeca rosetta]|eukprot:XP_004991456.1 hypothetical protein PTSG_07657 [Salpingoeca rosetta]